MSFHVVGVSVFVVVVLGVVVVLVLFFLLLLLVLSGNMPLQLELSHRPVRYQGAIGYYDYSSDVELKSVFFFNLYFLHNPYKATF